jgi:hypothetical protein
MSEQMYRPSWVDRLTARIESLPAPPWLTYLVLAAPWAVVFVGVQACQGTYQESGFYAWHLFVVVQPLLGIAAIHYLDRLAASAFQRFRSAMSGSQADFDSALYQLTTLPARQTTIASLLGLLFAAVQLSLSGDPGASMHVASTPISLTVSNVNIIVAWIGYAVVFYHGYHQLRVIDWLYRSRAIIDPFHPQPLYALSEITSSTAILLLVVTYGWFGVATGGSLRTLPTEPGFYITSAGVLALGVFIFVWPLWGAHRLLVDAKNHALNRNASNYKTALEELHRAVSSRELDEIEIWEKAIAATDLERRHVDRLATWPWSPGTFRNFLFALLVPIIVWIIQYGLQELMQ